MDIETAPLSQNKISGFPLKAVKQPKMPEKSLCERLMEAYTSDASKHAVRRWKKEYMKASKAERINLRRKNPERTDIYDYLEKDLNK